MVGRVPDKNFAREEDAREGSEREGEGGRRVEGTRNRKEDLADADPAIQAASSSAIISGDSRDNAKSGKRKTPACVSFIPRDAPLRADCSNRWTMRTSKKGVARSARRALNPDDKKKKRRSAIDDEPLKVRSVRPPFRRTGNEKLGHVPPPR